MLSSKSIFSSNSWTILSYNIFGRSNFVTFGYNLKSIDLFSLHAKLRLNDKYKRSFTKKKVSYKKNWLNTHYFVFSSSRCATCWVCTFVPTVHAILLCAFLLLSKCWFDTHTTVNDDIIFVHITLHRKIVDLVTIQTAIPWVLVFVYVYTETTFVVQNNEYRAKQHCN